MVISFSEMEDLSITEQPQPIVTPEEVSSEPEINNLVIEDYEQLLSDGKLL